MFSGGKSDVVLFGFVLKYKKKAVAMAGHDVVQFSFNGGWPRHQTVTTEKFDLSYYYQSGDVDWTQTYFRIARQFGTPDYIHIQKFGNQPSPGSNFVMSDLSARGPVLRSLTGEDRMIAGENIWLGGPRNPYNVDLVLVLTTSEVFTFRTVVDFNHQRPYEYPSVQDIAIASDATIFFTTNVGTGPVQVAQEGSVRMNIVGLNSTITTYYPTNPLGWYNLTVDVYKILDGSVEALEEGWHRMEISWRNQSGVTYTKVARLNVNSRVRPPVFFGAPTGTFLHVPEAHVRSFKFRIEYEIGDSGGGTHRLKIEVPLDGGGASTSYATLANAQSFSGGEIPKITKNERARYVTWVPITLLDDESTVTFQAEAHWFENGNLARVLPFGVARNFNVVLEKNQWMYVMIRNFYTYEFKFMIEDIASTDHFYLLFYNKDNGLEYEIEVTAEVVMGESFIFQLSESVSLLDLPNVQVSDSLVAVGGYMPNGLYDIDFFTTVGNQHFTLRAFSTRIGGVFPELSCWVDGTYATNFKVSSHDGLFSGTIDDLSGVVRFELQTTISGDDVPEGVYWVQYDLPTLTIDTLYTFSLLATTPVGITRTSSDAYNKPFLGGLYTVKTWFQSSRFISRTETFTHEFYFPVVPDGTLNFSQNVIRINGEDNPATATPSAIFEFDLESSIVNRGQHELIAEITLEVESFSQAILNSLFGTFDVAFTDGAHRRVVFYVNLGTDRNSYTWLNSKVTDSLRSDPRVLEVRANFLKNPSLGIISGTYHYSYRIFRKRETNYDPIENISTPRSPLRRVTFSDSLPKVRLDATPSPTSVALVAHYYDRPIIPGEPKIFLRLVQLLVPNSEQTPYEERLDFIQWLHAPVVYNTEQKTFSHTVRFHDIRGFLVGVPSGPLFTKMQANGVDNLPPGIYGASVSYFSVRYFGIGSFEVFVPVNVTESVSTLEISESAVTSPSYSLNLELTFPSYAVGGTSYVFGIPYAIVFTALFSDPESQVLAGDSVRIEVTAEEKTESSGIMSVPLSDVGRLTLRTGATGSLVSKGFTVLPTGRYSVQVRNSREYEPELLVNFNTYQSTKREVFIKYETTEPRLRITRDNNVIIIVLETPDELYDGIYSVSVKYRQNLISHLDGLTVFNTSRSDRTLSLNLLEPVPDTISLGDNYERRLTAGTYTVTATTRDVRGLPSRTSQVYTFRSNLSAPVRVLSYNINERVIDIQMHIFGKWVPNTFKLAFENVSISARQEIVFEDYEVLVEHMTSSAFRFQHVSAEGAITVSPFVKSATTSQINSGVWDVYIEFTSVIDDPNILPPGETVLPAITLVSRSIPFEAVSGAPIMSFEIDPVESSIEFEYSHTLVATPGYLILYERKKLISYRLQVTFLITASRLKLFYETFPVEHSGSASLQLSALRYDGIEWVLEESVMFVHGTYEISAETGGASGMVQVDAGTETFSRLPVITDVSQTGLDELKVDFVIHEYEVSYIKITFYRVGTEERLVLMLTATGSGSLLLDLSQVATASEGVASIAEDSLSFGNGRLMNGTYEVGLEYEQFYPTFEGVTPDPEVVYAAQRFQALEVVSVTDPPTLTLVADSTDPSTPYLLSVQGSLPLLSATESARLKFSVLSTAEPGVSAGDYFLLQPVVKEDRSIDLLINIYNDFSGDVELKEATGGLATLTKFINANFRVELQHNNTLGHPTATSTSIDHDIVIYNQFPTIQSAVLNGNNIDFVWSINEAIEANSFMVRMALKHAFTTEVPETGAYYEFQTNNVAGSTTLSIPGTTALQAGGNIVSVASTDLYGLNGGVIVQGVYDVFVFYTRSIDQQLVGTSIGLLDFRVDFTSLPPVLVGFNINTETAFNWTLRLPEAALDDDVKLELTKYDGFDENGDAVIVGDYQLTVNAMYIPVVPYGLVDVDYTWDLTEPLSSQVQSVDGGTLVGIDSGYFTEGTYFWKMSCQDALGNPLVESEEYRVRVDFATAVPSISVTYETGGVLQFNVVLNETGLPGTCRIMMKLVLVTDPDPGDAKVDDVWTIHTTLTQSGVIHWQYRDPPTDVSISSVDSPAGLVSGSYEVTVRHQDVWGNPVATSTPAIILIIPDPTPPSILKVTNTSSWVSIKYYLPVPPSESDMALVFIPVADTSPDSILARTSIPGRTHVVWFPSSFDSEFGWNPRLSPLLYGATRVTGFTTEVIPSGVYQVYLSMEDEVLDVRESVTFGIEIDSGTAPLILTSSLTENAVVYQTLRFTLGVPETPFPDSVLVTLQSASEVTLGTGAPVVSIFSLTDAVEVLDDVPKVTLRLNRIRSAGMYEVAINLKKFSQSVSSVTVLDSEMEGIPWSEVLMFVSYASINNPESISKHRSFPQFQLDQTNAADVTYTSPVGEQEHRKGVVPISYTLPYRASSVYLNWHDVNSKTTIKIRIEAQESGRYDFNLVVSSPSTSRRSGILPNQPTVPDGVYDFYVSYESPELDEVFRSVEAKQITIASPNPDFTETLILEDGVTSRRSGPESIKVDLRIGEGVISDGIAAEMVVEEEEDDEQNEIRIVAYVFAGLVILELFLLIWLYRKQLFSRSVEK